MKKNIWLILFLIIIVIAISYFHLWLILFSLIFLGMVLWEFISEYRGLYKMMKLDDILDKDYSTVIHFSVPLNKKKGFFTKVKFHVFIFFSCLNNALCWPMLVYWGMNSNKLKINSRIEQVASATIKPLQIYFTAYYMVISMVLAILYYFKLVDEKYILFYASLFCIGLISMLFTFLISEENLASIFKNSPSNIFQGVFFVCFKITISIIIFFCLILAVTYKSQIDYGIIKMVLNDFFKQENISLLWKRKFEGIKTLHLLINLSGLLFAATIIDTIKNFKSFKRQPTNYKAIAIAYLHRKQYNNSLEWLQKMPRQTWDLDSWKINMVILAGLNQVDKAIENFSHIHIGTDESDFVEDHKYNEFIHSAKSFAIDSMLINTIYAAWLANCKCDGIFFSNIFYFFILDNTEQDNDGLVKIFNQNEYAKKNLFLSNHLLNNDFDQTNFVNALKKDIEKDDTDVISRSLAHFYLIAFCFDFDIEPENEYKRLSSFDKSVTFITKPKDLTFLLLIMVGSLKAMQGKPTFYENVLFVYNKIKERISDPEHLASVNNVDYIFRNVH